MQALTFQLMLMSTRTWLALQVERVTHLVVQQTLLVHHPLTSLLLPALLLPNRKCFATLACSNERANFIF
jgi:hypothetical protein